MDRFDEMAAEVQAEMDAYSARASIDARRRIIANALRCLGYNASQADVHGAEQTIMLREAIGPEFSSDVAEEVLCMVHAFGDSGRKAAVRDLARRIDKQIADLREKLAKAEAERDALDSNWDAYLKKTEELESTLREKLRQAAALLVERTGERDRAAIGRDNYREERDTARAESASLTERLAEVERERDQYKRDWEEQYRVTLSHVIAGDKLRAQLAARSSEGLREAIDSSASATVERLEGACDGPGWYYWEDEYPEEGVVGAFATREEAEVHAREAGYILAAHPASTEVRPSEGTLREDIEAAVKAWLSDHSSDSGARCIDAVRKALAAHPAENPTPGAGEILAQEVTYEPSAGLEPAPTWDELLHAQERELSDLRARAEKAAEVLRGYIARRGAYAMNPLWSLVCSSVSLWLSKQSALPVDFQFQRCTQANAEFSGGRYPLGVFYAPPESTEREDGAA